MTFERVMMRCARDGCRRWITVSGSDTRHCPQCAIEGIVSTLEPVDMVAHIGGLPAARDDDKNKKPG